MATVEGSATIALAPLLRGVLGGSLLASGAATMAMDVGVAAWLARRVIVTSARAQSSRLIRVDFSDEVVVNDALKNPANYDINVAATTSVIPYIQSVDVPEATRTRSVQLVVADMTDGATYSVTGINIVSVGNFPIDSSVYAAFTGVGSIPAIENVIARSSTQVEVIFTEQIRESSDTRDAAAWAFDLGLVIESVDSFDGTSVFMTTAEQTEAELYTLTYNGFQQDFANNALIIPAVGTMLGYIEPYRIPGVVRRQKIYHFFIEGIRIEDQADTQFLERYLQGPQDIWQIFTETIMSIPKIWSVSDAPDDVLDYLKNIVGWTKRTKEITSRLDSDALRRLISASVPFWKQRGSDDALLAIISLLNVTRTRMLTWFDFRWVIGENGLGLVDSPGDPWIVNDPYRYNVRVVDDGTLDRTLVTKLVALTRPLGEYAEIAFITFLDQFETDNDDSQWGVSAGTFDVSDGRGKLIDDSGPEGVYVDIDRSDDWTNYVLSAVVQITHNATVQFYRISAADYYEVVIRTEAHGSSAFGDVALIKVVAGVPTTLVAATALPIPSVIWDGLLYSVRVEVTPEVPGSPINRIRVFFDEILVAETTDGDQVEGSIGFGHAIGGQIEVEIVELFQNPLTVVEVAPNS